MFSLVPFMIEKIGIIIVVAFLLSQLRSFRQIIQHKHDLKDKLKLIILFGSFGIISNYTGIEVLGSQISEVGWRSSIDPEAAIANTRVLGVVIGGLIGGPIVGIGTGLISSIHRYFLGGFTAFACSFSTIIAGIVAGFLGAHRKKKGKNISVSFAVAIGMFMESLEMVIILLLAKPFDLSLELVKLISFPMIVINGLGMMLFMLIIQHIKREDDRARAIQIDTAFSIAEKTLPYFKEGLNVVSSTEIAKIMLEMTDADAVSITNNHVVLTHVGIGSDHHLPYLKPETKLTNRVLKSGKIEVARSKEEIGCFDKDCPLEGAVVIPLKVKNKVVGTLKIYYRDAKKLDPVQEHLVYGLGELFSTQLELVEAEKQAKLVKDAKIKALQAQIHPHFLFNSLNTISALCRTNPEKARELLLDLAAFFRGNIQGARNLYCTLEHEIETVQAYIALVQARFPEKYKFHFHIEPYLKKCIVPPFILQPLVDNAVKYGFPGSKQKGDIIIQIYSEHKQLKIKVADNGKGIPEEKLKILGKNVVESNKGNGTALFNIYERLIGLYNNKAEFKIDSKVDQGTTVTISIPLVLEESEAVV